MSAVMPKPSNESAPLVDASITAIAPFLSIFISSMSAGGFSEMPPVSKQTPFPTIASRRPSGSLPPGVPPESAIRRGRSGACRRTASTTKSSNCAATSGLTCANDAPGSEVRRRSPSKRLVRCSGTHQSVTSD